MPASLSVLAFCLLPLALASSGEGGGAHLRAPIQSSHPGHPDTDGDRAGEAHPQSARPIDPPGGVPVGDTLEVHAWASAGISAHRSREAVDSMEASAHGAEEGASPEHAHLVMGPDVRMARLGGRVHYDHQGDIFFQFEAADGTARLLDARVSVELGEHLELRAGKMKASTSAEYLVPQPLLHHVNRARLANWVPKRNVGVEAILTPFRPGFDVQAAVFNVAGTQPVEGAGALVVGRIRLEPVHNLELHLSYTDHIEGHDASPEFHPRNNQLLDGAVELDTNGWMFHVEALGRMEHETHGKGLVTFASVGHHFGHDPEGFGLEPVVAYDHIVEEVGVTENAAVGMNILIHGHHLMQLTEVEVLKLPDGRMDQGIFFQLRGGV